MNVKKIEKKMKKKRKKYYKKKIQKKIQKIQKKYKQILEKKKLKKILQKRERQKKEWVKGEEEPTEKKKTLDIFMKLYRSIGMCIMSRSYVAYNYSCCPFQSYGYCV